MRRFPSKQVIDLPRPVWIVLFAMIIFLIGNLGLLRPAAGQCSTTSGQCYFPLAYDGMSEFWQPASEWKSELLPAVSARPHSLQMVAATANLDSDAQADGWRVALLLLDQYDQPIWETGVVRFELIPHPTGYRGSLHSAWVSREPIRWTIAAKPHPVDGITRLRLPMTKSRIDALSLVSKRHTSGLATVSVRRGNGDPVRRFADHSFSDSATGPSFTGPSFTGPTTGDLFARMTVPGKGTFESRVCVQIPPAILVDIR